MKRVTDICIGGRCFTLEDDAQSRLETYLQSFRARLDGPETQKEEVMEEIEGRIAEIFFQEAGERPRVVTLPMVEKVVSALGMPDGAAENGNARSSAFQEEKAPRKLYRDEDGKGVAGVCSGLAWYFGIDVTVIRIIMLATVLAAGSGFWIYAVLWVAVPKAETPAQQCEMRGIPATAENMARFSRHARDTYKR